MEPELRDLLDRDQIYQVLMRYCRAIDRADPELLQTVYHDGAVAKHWTGEFRDASGDFVEYAIPRLESFGTVTQHHITNCRSPSTATARQSRAISLRSSRRR